MVCASSTYGPRAVTPAPGLKFLSPRLPAPRLPHFPRSTARLYRDSLPLPQTLTPSGHQPTLADERLSGLG